MAFFIFLRILIEHSFYAANSGYPYQTSHSTASEMGLHCSIMVIWAQQAFTIIIEP